MRWPTGEGCWNCGKKISKANIPRLVKACTANEAKGGVRRNVRPEEGLARVYTIQTQQESMPKLWTDTLGDKHGKTPKEMPDVVTGR